MNDKYDLAVFDDAADYLPVPVDNQAQNVQENVANIEGGNVWRTAIAQNMWDHYVINR